MDLVVQEAVVGILKFHLGLDLLPVKGTLAITALDVLINCSAPVQQLCAKLLAKTRRVFMLMQAPRYCAMMCGKIFSHVLYSLWAVGCGGPRHSHNWSAVSWVVPAVQTHLNR